MHDPDVPGRVWDAPVRLFHWLLVLLVAVLWVTGEFGGINVSASLPLAGDVYLSNMDVHALAGQGVFVLVVFRILWGLWGSTTARFSHFVRRPGVVLAELWALLRGHLGRAVGHNPLGGMMVIFLLLLLLFQALSGMFSADDLFYEGPLTHLVDEDTVELASALHHQSFTVLQLLIIVHILAILYYLGRGQNLIGSMITGRKKPAPPAALAFSPWWLALVTLGLASGFLALLRSL